MTAPAALKHVYAPRGTCQQLMNSRADEVLLSGPAGTGKSRACLEKLLRMALLNPGMRGLIVRKTLVSLGSTALVTWREHVAKEALAAGDVEYYGGSQEEPPQYRFTNGSRIMIGGMDKPTKIMSSEYDVVYVQEAIELTEGDWEAITTRLRNGKITFQQLIADTNPWTPTHWLMARVNRGQTTMLHCRHEDNPTLFDEVEQPDGRPGYVVTEVGRAYIQKLDNLTGVRKARLRHGKWVAAEGLIYEGWNPAVHLVDDFPIPDEWPRYWGIDFGYTNPFCLQCWARDPDGRLYLYREIYHTKRLVEDHAAKILSIVRRPADHLVDAGREPDPKVPGDWVWTEPRPVAVFADHDAEGRATFEKATGLGTTAAHKAVTEGIQKVEKRLEPAGDGRPRLLILRGALVERDQALDDAKKPCCTAEEIPGYIWDTSGGKKIKETPLKEDDHGCDTGRYVVGGVDLGSRPNIRWL
jgi:phage terminase large subunit